MGAQRVTCPSCTLPHARLMSSTMLVCDAPLWGCGYKGAPADTPIIRGLALGAA
jgi:hypothetical protein